MMGLEIERKFLVDPKNDELQSIFRKAEKMVIINQGYLSIDKDRTVRIRHVATIDSSIPYEAFITIKGRTIRISRPEFEYPIDPVDALKMLDHMCLANPILKYRYHYTHTDGHLWEIDVFYNQNEGLIVAEIELDDEKETFELPSWVTSEVSDKKEYSNSNLTATPFQTWGTQFT